LLISLSLSDIFIPGLSFIKAALQLSTIKCSNSIHTNLHTVIIPLLLFACFAGKLVFHNQENITALGNKWQIHAITIT
jgi:hypothetical protein